MHTDLATPRRAGDAAEGNVGRGQCVAQSERHAQQAVKPACSRFGAPYAALFECCTPRQRRLLGDLGHDFRPGDFFDAPEDQAALMSGTA
jgi:hypothetical protein